jgi:glycine cleavage system transcriptional repressor
MNKAIFSILGQDRPGIVAAVSGILARVGCNIENVSQARLQTEFAGIFIVSMPDALSFESLEHELESGLTPQGLHVYIKTFEPPASNPVPAVSEPFIITTEGPDRRGLVADITEIIARYDANITKLQAVFKGGDSPIDNIMIYEVDVPLSVDMSLLQQDLRQKAESLDLEISIQHRNIFEAINRI